MAGTCKGTITITVPCTPSWVCEQPLNGYEKDGCGNRRLNTACNATILYREATISKCLPMAFNVKPGDTFEAWVEITGGSVTENYQLVLSGDITGTSILTMILKDVLASYPFRFQVPTNITSGTKYITATLVRA